MRRMRGRAERRASARPAPHSNGRDDVGQPGEIAGYRVLRRLAAGRSADVYLGHALPAPGLGGASHSAGENNPGETVALRVFHTSTDPERVDREVAVLCALPAGIAATLHDVVTLPDGRVCLVMQRDDGATLSELLRRRPQIRAGEAVTILAPLAVALDGLHRQGWSHGALNPDAVRFDPAGRVHLAGWGEGRPLPAGAPRTGALRAEYAGLAEITRAVCAAVDGASAAPHELEELQEWLDHRVGAHPFLPCAAEFERRLFALARALPVRLGEEPVAGTPAPGLPLRLTGAAAPTAGGVAAPGLATPGLATVSTVADDPDRPPVPLWRGWEVPAEIGRAGRAVGAALQRRLRAHRRPLLVATTLAAAFFVLTITLLPPGGERSGAAAPVAGVPAETPPVPTAPPAQATGTPPLARAGPSAAETDPVVAATLLLALREECFRRSSLLCLNDVLDSGGPLAAADAADIRRAQRSGTAQLPDTFAPASLSLIEQNGGAALLGLTDAGANDKPASLLMIRGEAGWRLREIFDY